MSPGEENNGLTEDENKELERNYRLRSKMINNEKFSKNILARIEIINISINIIYCIIFIRKVIHLFTFSNRLWRAARSYIALSHETLKLFGYVSEGASALMVHSSLVHRISEMSNFFLNMLVGSKRKSLKIKGLAWQKKLTFIEFDCF